LQEDLTFNIHFKVLLGMLSHHSVLTADYEVFEVLMMTSLNC